MPTIRYQVRSEFGLGNPELYGAANKEDPEALLEGVAMAGLIGILKQLGDLAEFASEIFQDLHKELTTTSTRGQRLMLRVRQVEAEFSVTEKAFISQSSQTEFCYNHGINWHTALQLDHNLVTSGEMPQFIMDSYEECRGPPQLFVLDKYDAGGVGACLKRYSNPSLFKIELASSGTMEAEAKEQKQMPKNMKKAPCWMNNENLSGPNIISKLQSTTSEQASDKVTLMRGKLKPKHLNGPEAISNREHLIQVLSHEVNSLSENSESYSNIEVKSIASSESISERQGTSSDASDIERNLGQSPTIKDVTEMVEKQRITVKEFRQALPENERTDGPKINSSDASPSGSQDHDQEEFLTESDWITEGSGGGYCSCSDSIGSDVGDFVDARNIIESEVETDCESNGKPNPNFFTGSFYQGVNSNIQDETHLRTSEHQTSCKSEIDSPEKFLYDDSCNANVADSPNSTSEYREESFNCSIKDSLPSRFPINLDRKLLCKTEISAISSQTKSDFFLDAVPSDANQPFLRRENNLQNIYQEEYAEELVLKDMSVSDKCFEDSPTSSNLFFGKPEEPTVQSRNASQSGMDSPFRHSFPPMDTLCVPKNNLSPQTEVASKNINFDPVFDADSAKFNRSCSPIEMVSSCENLAGENVTVEADNNNHEGILNDVVSNEDASIIQEKLVPMKITEKDEVNTPHISLSAPIEAQLMAFSVPLDANFLKDVLHIAHTSYEHAQKDVHHDNIEKDCINSVGTENDSCQRISEPFEEVQAGSITNTIPFERDLSLSKNKSQTNSIDISKNNSQNSSVDSIERLSNITENVSFTEFLKLTQMDSLVNFEEEEFVDSLQNEKGFGSEVQFVEQSNNTGNYTYEVEKFSQLQLEAESHLRISNGMNASVSSECSSQLHENLYSEPISFIPTQDNESQETTEVVPPLPPLPPIQWRMGKLQMGNVTPHLEMESAAIDVKSSHDFLQCCSPSVERGEVQSVNSSLDILHLDEKFSEGVPVDEYAPENFTEMVEDAKPIEKLDKPRDPLIEAVASHDKSMLRKVPKIVQPFNKSKTDEEGSLLEHIRTRSLSLKPRRGGAKPNLRGPSTNLKVAAILERANAIRQAFVGSDDDEDGDSWSDS